MVLEKIVSRLAVVAAAVALAGVTASAALATPGWVSSTDLSETTANASAGKVAIDGSGNTTVAWLNQRGAEQSIVVTTRPAGATWQAPIRLSAATGEFAGLDVAANAAGDVVVIWARKVSTTWNVEAALKPHGATSWQPPTPLATDLIGNPFPTDLRVALDGRGDATAAWTTSAADTTTFAQSARFNVGAGWEPVTKISGAITNVMDTTVGSDGAGNASAIFAAGGRVYSATRAANGAWAAPVAISPADESALKAAATTNDGGETLVAWSSSSGGGTVRAMSHAPGAPWGPVATVSSKLDAIWDQLSVALNAHGDALVGWSNGTAGGPQQTWGVQVAERPAGAAWQVPATLASGSEAEAPPILASLPDGGAAVLWSQTSTSFSASVSTRVAGGGWSPAQPLAPGQTTAAASLAADTTGDLLALTTRVTGVSPAESSTMVATPYDVTKPTLGTVAIPTAGFVGAPVTVSAAPADLWSPVTAASWQFGDGTSATGNSPAGHVFTKPGTFNVTVTTADAAANTASATTAILVKRPAVSALRVRPGAFRAANSDTRTRAGAGSGAAVSYSLKLITTVRFTVERSRTGRRAGGSCAAVTARNRRDAPCKRFTKVTGSLERKSNGGNDRFRFSGRLNQRKLSPGRYRLVATPRPGGYPGRAVTAPFRIKR